MKKALLFAISTIASSLVASLFWGGPPDGPSETYNAAGDLT
jgi:hypothetical protein